MESFPSVSCRFLWRKNFPESSYLSKGKKCDADGDEAGICRSITVGFLVIVLQVFMLPLVAADETASRLNEKILFNIPQQRADKALVDFAEQAAVTFMFPFDEARHKNANRLIGEYTLSEGLNILLEGTGLEPKIDNDRVLIVNDTPNQEGGNMNSADRKKQKGIIASLLAAITMQGDASMAQTATTVKPLEEIIVTAEKRARNLQEVPISITAFNEETLEANRIQDVTDIANHTPNFFFNQSRPSAPGLTIRGVGSNIRQGQAGIDRSVIVYVDEVFIGRGGGQVFNLFDLERVEVLRGPQGTLFGRNAAGGAVHIVTKKPSANPYTKLKMSVGNYSLIETNGVLNGPLSDNLYGKVSFSTRDRNGVNNNIFTGNKIEDINSRNVRGQLKYVPNDELQFLFSLDYMRDEIVGVVQRPINGEGLFDETVTGFVPADGFRDFQNPVDGFLDRDIYGISGRMDWETVIGTLTSITALRVVDFSIDFPGVGAPGGPDFSPEPTLDASVPGFLSRQPQDEQSDTFTQEIRLASGSEGTQFAGFPGRFQWTVGGYFLSESTQQRHRFKRNLSLVGAATNTSSWVQQNQDSDVDSYALFGNVTYQISDRFELSFGARQTWETRGMALVASDLDPNKLVTNSIAPLLAEFAVDNEKDFNSFTPKGTISYFPNSGPFKDTETMFYASVSKGFKSGGFDGQSFSEESANTPFLKEEATNYEVGFRSRFFNNRVQLNGTFFWLNFENLQLFQRVLTVPGDQASATLAIVNAKEARIRGIEADAIIKPFATGPLSGFTLSGNVGFQDSELTDATLQSTLPGLDADGLRPAEGQSMPRAPELNYYISGTYEVPIRNGNITFRVSDRYTGDTFFDLGEPSPGGFQEGYHLVDASITYVPDTAGNWEFKVWAKNLFDEEYFVAQQAISNATTAIGRIGEPLTYGVSILWNWEK